MFKNIFTILVLLLCATVPLSAQLSSRTLDPRTYGARGDGVVDDSAAIQAALDAIAGTKRTLYAAGTYRIVTPITVSTGNFTLDGGGTFQCENPTANTNCLTIEGAGLVGVQTTVNETVAFANRVNTSTLTVTMTSVPGTWAVDDWLTFKYADGTYSFTQNARIQSIASLDVTLNAPLLIPLTAGVTTVQEISLIEDVAIKNFSFEGGEVGQIGLRGNYLTNSTFENLVFKDFIQNAFTLGSGFGNTVDTIVVENSGSSGIAGIRFTDETSSRLNNLTYYDNDEAALGFGPQCNQCIDATWNNINIIGSYTRGIKWTQTGWSKINQMTISGVGRSVIGDNCFGIDNGTYSNIFTDISLINCGDYGVWLTGTENDYNLIDGLITIDIDNTAVLMLGSDSDNTITNARLGPGASVSTVFDTGTNNKVIWSESILFANLDTSAIGDGSRVFITDGTEGSDPCVGSGTGSWAERLNGRWICGATGGGGATTLVGLTDVSAKTGTGTVVVMQAAPTITGLLDIDTLDGQPASDSTTAFLFKDSLGAAVLDVDTTNSRVGIGTNAPTVQFHVKAANGTSDSFMGMGVDPSAGGNDCAINVGYAGASIGAGTGFLNVRSCAGGDPLILLRVEGTTELTVDNGTVDAANALTIGGVAVPTISSVSTLTNKVIDGVDAGAATTRSNENSIQLASHNTDCTSLTDGLRGEACWEEDADNLYICEPTAGGCDTPSEWILATGAGGAEVNNLEVDGAVGILDTEVIIGTGAGTTNYAAVSGDATLANTGVLTIGADTITTGKLDDGADSPVLGHFLRVPADTTTIEYGDLLAGDGITLGDSGGDVTITADVTETSGTNTFSNTNNFLSGIVLLPGASGAPAAGLCTGATQNRVYFDTDDAGLFYGCYQRGAGTYTWEILLSAGDFSGDATVTDAGVVSLGTDSVSANELNATGVEAELEAVLDIPELQGSATDAQVDDDITVDGTDAGAATTRTTFAKIQMSSHNTDCTSLTDGLRGEACWEEDANTIYVCEPTAGGCDTAGEWIQITSGAVGETNSLEADGTVGILDGEIFIGTGAGTGNYATPSGDVSMTNAGVVTVLSGDSATGFFPTGVIENSRGGTGQDTSSTTGIPQLSAGTWGFNAGVIHLAVSSSSNLRAVINDEVGGTGNLVFNDNPTLAGATINGANLILNDGATDSPQIQLLPQTGTQWDVFVEDTGDDLQISVTSAVAEDLDINNLGAGVIDVNIDGTLTVTTAIAGPNVTTGADPGHTHGTTSISGLDISDDTNLAVSAPIVLTGDTLSLTQDPGTDVTGDLEEETHASEHTAGGADIITVDGTDAGAATTRTNPNPIQISSHNTDCTSLTDGVRGEQCWEEDANTIYVCEPTAGGCDTAGEWVQITSGSATETNDLETDDPPTILDTEIYIGTGAGTGVFVSVSGDGSLSNAGVLTINDDSHGHTTTTVSGLDISADTNLAVSSPITLTDDTVGLEALGGDVSGTIGNVVVDDVQTATANLEAADNNTTQVATTSFVQQEINGAGGTNLTCSAGVCNVDSLDASTDTNVATDAYTKTNLTLDGEGTGNAITLASYVTFPFALCTNGTTAVASVHLPTSNAPAAACVTTANGQAMATLDFDATTVETVQLDFRLPPGFTGNVDGVVVWRTTATTGNVVFQWESACVADGEDENPTWNTLQSWSADAADAQADDWNSASQTNLTMTDCTADENLWVRFGRDADNASDTINSNDVRVKELRLTIRNTF